MPPSQCTNKPVLVQRLRKYAAGFQSQTIAVAIAKAKHYAAGQERHFEQQTQSTRQPKNWKGAALVSC